MATDSTIQERRCRVMEMQQQKSEYTGCNNCKHTNVDARDYPCNECKHAVTTFNHYEPISNADVLRNMTDEDLAEFLDKMLNQDREDCDPIGCYGCVYYGTHHQNKNSEYYKCGDCEFEGGLLQWLQSEVKEDDSDAG